MKLHLALICALSVAAISPAYADEPIPKKLCIFDPAGVNGSIFTMMKDYQLEALKWGIKFEMKPYTDEKTAADDFKAGQCDAALITGTRVRPFIPFGGTLEAMGALPDYGLVQGLLKFLSKPTSAKALESGDR
ncbi:MAG: hypothetical protein KC620_04080 [Myxococcales bacterium]|nr:hypothetical protein [Myxococcales bacterium]